MRKMIAALALAAFALAPASAQYLPPSVQGSGLATAQVAVSTAPVQIVAGRPGRINVTIIVSSAVQCSFGGPGVTLATGFPLPAVAGATQTFATGAALYAVCASSTTIGEVELY